MHDKLANLALKPDYQKALDRFPMMPGLLAIMRGADTEYVSVSIPRKRKNKKEDREERGD